MFPGPRALHSRLGILFVAVSVTACSANEALTEPESELDPVNAPWVAYQSVARAQNPERAVGDEHNRLLHVGIADSRAKGVRNWTREAKCRWLANLVYSEATSSRSPGFVRDNFRGMFLDAAKFEKATARLGCQAQDAGVVALGSPILSTLLAQLQEGDTVDYEPSPGAQYYLGQIEAAHNNASTPAQLDAALAGIQTAADSLWDKEAVLSSASVSASSGFYWQGEFGGTSGGGWVEEPECSPPECYETVRQSSIRIGGPMAHSTAGEIAKADALGCIASLVPSRKSIWSWIWHARKIVNPGVMAAECAIYAALASLAEYEL